MSQDVTLVSAATVARLDDGALLEVNEPYIVTPSAAELAAKKNVHIRAGGGNPGPAQAARACPPHRSGNVEARLDYARELASYMDSSLLSPQATPHQIEALCREAAQLHFAAVCVNPLFVMTAAEALDSAGPRIVSTCGFPLGAQQSAVKAAEAQLAANQGAHEIDMVPPIGMLKAGNWEAVRDDIANVRKMLSKPGMVLKVIIEAPLLTDEEKVTASVIAVEAGADFVKTGTGMHGPACPADVALIRQAIGDRAKIKAAGGIGDCKTAVDLLEAGADRLGTSCAAEIIRDCQLDGS